jgi:hypothetical protein
MVTSPSAEPQYLIAFLPWLRLREDCQVAGVEFVSFRDGNDHVHPALAEIGGQVSTILSSYVDLEGSAIANCTIAMTSRRGWNLTDADFETVQWAASLLFLSAWACNEYFPKFFGPYVSSSNFRVTWQRFTGNATYIAINAKRRDGRTLIGGYEHGELKFTRPVQCVADAVTVDSQMLRALDEAHTKNTKTIGRLQYATSFIELANTDDDLMRWMPEAILMASAFEQMLDVEYKRDLVTEFESLLVPFGSVTVTDAMAVRPGIWIDPQYAATQPGWFVHKKWIEELYDLRSKSVHDGTHLARAWGWTPHEHLVMAAFVFPLMIKLMLEREGVYGLTEDDRVRCLAVDKLLARRDWQESGEDGPNPRNNWSMVLYDIKREMSTQRAVAFMKDLVARREGQPRIPESQ